MGVECARLLCEGGAHGKNFKPNHSRGKLAAQGIQILFSLHQSGPQSGPHWEANSAGPGIIGGQRGCLHFRRLHIFSGQNFAHFLNGCGLFRILNLLEGQTL